MKTVTKIIISIASSILIFTLLTFFAFISGFKLIENNFYNKKVSIEILESLNKSVKLLQDYHLQSIDTLQETLTNEYVNNIFDSRYTDTEIVQRDKVFKELNRRIRGYDSIRVLGDEGKRIQYSTLDKDIKTQDSERRIYNNLNQVEADDFYDRVSLGNDEEYKILYLQETNQFLYVLKYIDRYDQNKGLALFYVSSSGYRYLASQAGFASSSEEVFVLNNNGVLFNISNAQFQQIQEEVNRFWSKSDPLSQVYLTQGENGSNLLFTENIEGIGSVGRVVPASDLEISIYMKFLLLLTLLVVIILLNFLIFNLRQDRSVVLSHRIKRFQIKFLQDYIENKENLDSKTWKDEIQSRRKQVRNELFKNLGNYGRKHKDEIDQLISKSWDDIIEVISSKIPAEEEKEESSLDIDKIEEILEKVLAKGVKVKGFEDGIAVPAVNAPSRKRKKQAADDFSDMKPIEVEELEELDELDSEDDFSDMKPIEVEEVEELDELDSDDDFSDMKPIEVEDVEELYELDSDDDFSDMKPIEVEDVEELDDSFDEQEEALEELDEEEELDELDSDDDYSDMKPIEVEDVEELDELDSDDDFSDMKPIEVENVEELDDSFDEQEGALEELDELEEVLDVEIDLDEEESEEINNQNIEVSLDDQVEMVEDLEEIDEVIELDGDELEDVTLEGEVLEELEEPDDIYMFDSPDETEKRYRDALSMNDVDVDFEVYEISELLEKLYGDEVDISGEKEIPQDSYSFDSSIVTVQDFDLNLFSESSSKKYDDLETESFGIYGYNLDMYLQHFPSSSSRLYKGMLKITKHFDTHAGALVSDDDVIVNLAVEMDLVNNVTKEIKAGSFGNIEQKNIIALRETNSSLYNRIFKGEDTFKELLILPVKYNHNKNSYLILFYIEMKKDIIKDIEDLKVE